MNNYEVGMYVRYLHKRDGKDEVVAISKIKKIVGRAESSTGDIDIYLYNEPETYIWNPKHIIKASFDITDLIDVGDYVNGEKVFATHKHYVWDEQDIGTAIETEHEYTAILNEDIKSIVTKEQFEQMKYEVE